MVDQLVDDPTTAQPPKRKLGARLLAALVALVVVTAVVTGVAVAFHYNHAPALRCGCGLVWSRADYRTEHDSVAGAHQAMNVASRAPRRQSFYVDIVNDSSVTQTFLGLGHDESETVYRGVLAISTVPDFPSDKTEEELDYTTRPVDIPPGGQYTLRYTFTAGCMPAGGAMVFEQLDVKVRTGWFTRVETVGFGDVSFVVKGTRASEQRAGC